MYRNALRIRGCRRDAPKAVICAKPHNRTVGGGVVKRKIMNGMLFELGHGAQQPLIEQVKALMGRQPQYAIDVEDIIDRDAQGCRQLPAEAVPIRDIAIVGGDPDAIAIGSARDGNHCAGRRSVAPLRPLASDQAERERLPAPVEAVDAALAAKPDGLFIDKDGTDIIGEKPVSLAKNRPLPVRRELRRRRLWRQPPNEASQHSDKSREAQPQ